MNEEKSSGVQYATDAMDINLFGTTRILSAAVEKRLAHIGEQANAIVRRILFETGTNDIMQAIFTEEDAARLYREMTEKQSEPLLFGQPNVAEEVPFRRGLARFDSLIRCRVMAETAGHHKLETLYGWMFGLCGEIPSGSEKKIAFLHNTQASRAFEQFAKYIGGVSAVYEGNFQNACEAVAGGRATFALLPIANTSDGRLNGFYRLIDKYELSIVMTCVVESEDTTTVFALVYSERLFVRTSGMPLYECRITLDDLSELADLLDAAHYFGIHVVSADMIPVMFSGRENTFGLVFDLPDGAETDAFLCYLSLEHPQAASVGLYYRTEGNLS